MSPPIKNIVLLTDCLEDFAGGAEKQILELAKGLDKSKYRVTIISLDCSGQASKELVESTGCRLMIFRVVRIYGFSGFVQGVRFFLFLKKEKVDLVQTYHFSSDIWGTFWAYLASVPVLISNRRDMGFWRKAHHVMAYRLMNPWVKKIVVNAQSIQKAVISMEKVDKDKVDTIYNGIDLPVLSSQLSVVSLKKELGIKENEVVIMHVANLKPIKGHTYLLQAVAHIILKLPNIKLVLIGKDELAGAIHLQAKELSIEEKIIFLGKRQDVSRLLTVADICVLPSLSEGMSNAILEYMVAGKAVVATDVGGNPELIVNGYNGILVKKENAKELGEALLTLIEDSPMRNVLGQNGIKRAEEHFSSSAMIIKYEKLYAELLHLKRNILHLVSSGGLYGAEQVILNLAQAKEVTNYVGAINNAHNPHLEIIEEAGKRNVKTAVFDSSGRFDCGAIFRVKNFLVHHNIDIIHTHNYKSDIVGFFAAKLSGKKWIATNHVWHGTNKKLKFYECADAFLLRFADRVIAVSQEIKNDLVQKGVAENKIQVIHNGIDVSKFDRMQDTGHLKSEIGIAHDDFVVAIVGRLSPEKGHGIFLKAAKKVAEKIKNIKFLIVGDGPLRENLQNEIQATPLVEKVIFAGIRNDMRNIYSMSDVLVNSSFIEGLPMTILEAMAARLPVIATKVGAIPQVIEHEVNGILLEPGNPDVLAETIVRLAGHSHVRQAYTQKAYQDVCCKYDARKMIENYQLNYERVLT